MGHRPDVWAVLPVKEIADAKQRLAGILSAELRRRLALAMMEDVLSALAATPRLSGIAVVTIDPMVEAVAARYGARVLAAGARDGHTGAVVAAARRFGLEPKIVRAPGIALDIDRPGDVAAFSRLRSNTRTQAFLDSNGLSEVRALRAVAGAET